MPKAAAFAPEDEKTTIESGWEEEASTTVEQGEVADKIRALQNGRNTNITSTNNSVVDEPTVDDQRAHAAIVMLPPPSLAAARLVVTQGNDTGQQIEIVPGKTYTIGRGIDNDFVLTDIAVSRKHFDLRHDNDAWVVEDRRSGNGTLVNGNLEDQPFVLANGDLIEIGNTTFRFEQENAPPRPARPAPLAGRYDIQSDEEEQSTVAGKPIRSDGFAPPAQMAPPPARPRPKTVPPPVPVPPSASLSPAPLPAPPAAAPAILPRPRSGTSQPPPVTYPMGSRSSGPGLAGLPGLPQHKPASAPQPPMSLPPQPQPMPMRSQPQPQLLVSPKGSSQPQPMPMPQPMPQPQLLMPQPQPQLHGGGRSAPMAPGMIPADAMPGRPSGIPSTIPGQGLPAAPSHPQLPYSYPSVADMHKHAMLVVGNGPPRDATSTALVQPTPYGAAPASIEPMPAPAGTSRRTKLLLAGAGLTLLAAVATIAILKGTGSSKKDDPPVEDRGGSAKNSVLAPDELDEPQKIEPQKTEPQKTEPQKTEPQKTEPQKTEPQKTEPTEPQKTEPTEPQKTEPTEPQKTEPTEPQKTEPTRPTPPQRVTTPPPRPTPPQRVTPPPPRRQVAVKPDTSGARSRANELYRQKKFNEAAAVLTQAAASISGNEASALRSTASAYQQLGIAYNRGMAPAAKAIDAYTELNRALNYDAGSAGGAFSTEIRNKLAQVAPKAAITFYARKDFVQAFKAVRLAEGNGVTNSDTAFVRQKLEEAAKELYDTAAKELNTSPDAAKQKLKLIKGMVDGKSPTLAKANALLAAS